MGRVKTNRKTYGNVQRLWATLKIQYSNASQDTLSHELTCKCSLTQNLGCFILSKEALFIAFA